MDASWLLFAVTLWTTGYFLHRWSEPDSNSKLTKVPQWMFILFGAPKCQNVPVTVLGIGGIYFQLLGISTALYYLLLDQVLVKEPLLSGAVGLFGSMLISYVVTFWLYRKWPYRITDHMDKGDKLERMIHHRDRLERMIRDLEVLERSIESPESHLHLLIPSIIRSLEYILEIVSSDRPDRENIRTQALGLGRIAMEDYRFSDSPIGTELIKLLSDISRID